MSFIIFFCTGEDSNATSDISSFTTCASSEGCGTTTETTETSEESDGETPRKKRLRSRGPRSS